MSRMSRILIIEYFELVIEYFEPFYAKVVTVSAINSQESTRAIIYRDVSNFGTSSD